MPPGDAGAGPLNCVALDAGLSICLKNQQGQTCAQNSDCASPWVCATGGLCDYPDSQIACSGTTCHPGDDCSANASDIENNGTSSDPCFSSGLICVVFDDLTGTEQARCLTPTVGHPPFFPDPDPAPFDQTICNATKPICATDSFAAPRAAPTCGGFFLSGESHCLEGCNAGDDCDSIVWDCVQGSCKPNYCFAAGSFPLPDGGSLTNAANMSPYQLSTGGLPISADPHVLFNPCALDGGAPTACLPQYDDAVGFSTGLCVRVEAPDAGGWGPSVIPIPTERTLGGLCAEGTFCDLGTCLPWCDLGTSAFVQCPSGTTCSPLPPGPLISSASGGTNSIGVCAEACDPYQDAAHNTCPPFGVSAGAPMPGLGCKFSESQNDIHPAPGVCLAAIENPIAVGSPCAPFGWVDPCVSGAECVEAAGDGGTAFICAQLCDPSPSPGVTPPGCSTGKTCIAFQSCNLPNGCSHEGACQ